MPSTGLRARKRPSKAARRGFGFSTYSRGGPDESQPKPEDYETLIGWIEKDFLAAQCGQGTSSAAVAIRRLNRREYNNTIRDLLGLNLNLADDFPADDIGFGFDNVGSALNISPVHVEKYLDAAELAMDQAIVTPDADGVWKVAIDVALASGFDEPA